MANVLNYLRRLAGLNRNAKLYLLSTALNGLGLSLFVLLYNLYILSLGFHEDMIGFVTLLASFVAVIAALPMGWVANRLGYKLAQIVGVGGSALSVVFPLVLPTRDGFILCELLWGVTFTLMVIVSGPYMTENSSEEDRPYLFSIQFVLTMATMFMGTLFGGELPRLFGVWFNVGAESPAAYQGALWVGTGLLFVSALPLVFLKATRHSHAHTGRPRLAVREPRKVARLLLPTLIGAAGGGMFIPFVNVLWKVSFHMNDATIGQILAVSALLVTVMSMFAPPLTRRWGLVRVMVVSQVLSVVGLLAFGFSPWWMVALVAYLGRDALVNLSRPLNVQFQMEHSLVEERAAVSSLSTMFFNLAWGLGSWVSGIWQTEGQFALMFGVCAGFYLGSALLLQTLFGNERKPEPELKPEAATPRVVTMGVPAE